MIFQHDGNAEGHGLPGIFHAIIGSFSFTHCQR